MIGVYGGTFDPIHYGHLRSALEVREALGLSHIRFIPCGQPPHRSQPHASAAQRLAMVDAAIAGVPEFISDVREISRQGPSYMIDTLRDLRQELPDQELCLLLGMDAFAALHTWHEWRGLVQLCNIVVMHRPEFEPAQVIRDAALQQWVAENQARDTRQFCGSRAGRVLFYPVTQLDIASTRIREAIKQRRSVRYLLPDSVISMIERDGIYH